MTMDASEQQARINRAYSCFSLAAYYRDLGNEILRPVRERAFEPVDADDTIEGSAGSGQERGVA